MCPISSSTPKKATARVRRLRRRVRWPHRANLPGAHRARRRHPCRRRSRGDRRLTRRAGAAGRHRRCRRSTAPCSAVHHPMRPPTSVPVRPRRSRRQPTRSMPTRSSSTTNSPRPSNTTSRRFSAGRRSIAPPSFSTFSPRTPAARRARPRWNSLSCATASRASLKRTHLLPAGRRYRYQGPG